jgi:hypothetical protein
MGNGSVDVPLDPWAVSETDYPNGADIERRVRFLLRYAILAPSGHNTQPWLFGIRGGTIELRADRTRALPVVDPDDRALVISCGAALGALRIAARRFGFAAAVESLPNPNDEDLLARVTLEQGDPPSEDDNELFAAIPERRSNRQAFEDRDLPGDLAERLVADAQEEGVWLHPARGDDRAAIAGLIAEGDMIQMADKRFRRELASWVHPNRDRSHDGMRGYGFGFGELMSHAGPLVIRAFDLGRGQAAKDRELAEGSPLLSVFVTESDDPAAWLGTGQALQRVLLRARAAQVWSSFLNQPVEVPELRPRLAETIGWQGDYPQLVVRLGYGPQVKPEPRRAVEEVLWREEPS